MLDAGILGAVIEKFVSPQINVSHLPVLNSKGEVILPGLDNHAMGTVFEELIRRFNDENNEEAGEHFTPWDVIELMADLIFLPIADKILVTVHGAYCIKSKNMLKTKHGRGKLTRNCQKAGGNNTIA